MRTISAQEITNTVARLCIEANTRLPQDVQNALDKARQEEPWPLAKNTLDLLWSNLSAAKEQDLPICQDTGMACVFVELGTDVHIDGSFEAAIHEGVRRGYTDGYLRKSIVADPLRRGNTGDSLQHIGKVMINVYDRLEELAASGSEIPGLSTGLHDLDRKINGLNKTDLILIAARPGMGKTAIALNICLNVAKTYEKTVAFFSLEMSREQLVMRLLSTESFVENQKLTTGHLEDDDWSKLSIASSALSQTDIRVDDNPAITVAEINAKCRRLDNLGLVLIDYLQLMTAAAPGKSGDNRVTIVSDISRALKIMAKELNVPVICLSQLSRANESRTDKRPMLSDLRESGAIEQDADSVLFLYRDEYYNPNTQDKNIAECIIAKNRHGETGPVKLQWRPQFFTFSDLEWKHEG